MSAELGKSISATGPKEALGQSEVFLSFSEALSRVAKIDRPVLIMGERGTGKELAAGRLHYLSHRWRGPLVTLNCAALTPTLIEAELFGHEAGAFTGAARGRAGRFEAADKGTLFLDEIANTPVNVQEKILRVVEYGVFERVGSSRPIEVDVRIIGAANTDLRALVRRGLFKEDLLDRLCFEVLTVPPLRSRGEDIMLLANHFASRMAFEMKRDWVPFFSPWVAEQLMGHQWPGNVRELKNVVERAVYQADQAEIKELRFDPFGSPARPSSPVAAGRASRDDPPHEKPPPEGLKEAVARYEAGLAARALVDARFNQRAAAANLGLTYHQLRAILRKHGGVEGLLALAGVGKD